MDTNHESDDIKIMVKIGKLVLVVALGLGMSTPARSIVIEGGPHDGTDVGGIDTYLKEISGMNSGDQTVTDWVNLILATEFEKEDLSKTENVKWFFTDVNKVIAFKLQTGPGYYVVKNARLHVLFQNAFDFDWGVINLGSISGDIKLGDDMKISHVSEFGESTPVPVPEPGSLGLLGAGLLILGLFRRRKTLLVRAAGSPAMARA